MYGAILGDIIGSPYEFDEKNIKTKEFELFADRSEFTDDTVMTVSIADALMNAGGASDADALKSALISSLQKYGRRYPLAGYGMDFSLWLAEDAPKPYNSFGNGAAVRVSAAAWLNQSDFARMRAVARTTAVISHNHQEGVKGADAVACAIFLALHKKSKEEIKEFISKNFGYNLNRTCDEIRPDYHFTDSCQETVPQAITAFLEGTDFEDVIRNAVSLGGDSDTLAAIAGSIAEAFYGVPENLKTKCREMLPEDLLEVLDRFDKVVSNEKKARENNPALQQAWDKAMEPKRKPAPKRDGFAGNEAIEKAIDELRAARTQQNVAKVLETIRVRMNAGGQFFVPVRATEEEMRTGVLKDPKNFKMQAVKTNDGKTWQPAYTSKEQLGRSSSRPTFVITVPMDMFLRQFTEEADEKTKMPDILSGIALNPEDKNFVLNRNAIKAILAANQMAKSGSKVLLAKGDIAVLKCDCIVNATDSKYTSGTGVTDSILNAGGPGLADELSELDECKVGEVKMTGGYDLPAAHVIHTVGPVYSGAEEDAGLLASCYINALNLAKAKDLKSIAFPAISTGSFGYPVEEAAKVAVTAIFGWMNANRDYGMQIILCCANDEIQQTFKKMLEQGIQRPAK